MTPYRDEQPQSVARTTTRFHFAPKGALLIIAAVLFAAIAASLVMRQRKVTRSIR